MRLPARVLAFALSAARALAPAAVVACNDSGGLADEASALNDDGPGSCGAAPLRVYDEYPGTMERLYVDLPVEASRMPFLIDTGANITYRRVVEAAYAPPPARSALSCDTATFPRVLAHENRFTPDDVVVGGTIGGNALADGALDLDISNGVFGWTPVPKPLPLGAVTLPATFHVSSDPWAENMLTATGVRLDGVDVELLVDTGAPHVLIISKDPRPDEEQIETYDGNGNPVTLYISTIEIAFGDGPALIVDVDRAESFPSLEKTFAALGGRVSGILGLGALGHERVVLSKTSVSFVPPATSEGNRRR
jgi:hypothetical protein